MSHFFPFRGPTPITEGNWRLLHRLWQQIERLMQINGLQVITSRVVEAARENLVIGQN